MHMMTRFFMQGIGRKKWRIALALMIMAQRM